MNDFEDLLKQQPMRPIPTEWRNEILSAARLQQKLESDGWLAWLWPSPIAWGAVAAAWILILGLNLLSQSSLPETGATVTISPQEIESAFFQQRQLVQELQETMSESPQNSHAPGACNQTFPFNTVI